MHKIHQPSNAVSLMTAVNNSEMKISNNPAEILVAFSIGSGIGVTIHDPVAAVGGILNFILPNSSELNKGSGKLSPFMFADTGIPAFLDALLEMDAKTGRMKVVIAGGAKVMDQCGAFNIGQQNRRAAHDILSQHHIAVHYEDIGGNYTRTLHLDIGSGSSLINIVGQGEKII